jgi:UDP-N-acetylmuramoylalanine--D-glutamate ligase
MFKNQRYYVLGAAKSGLAAARFLAEHGAQVWINDLKGRTSLDETALADLEALGVICILGEHGNPAAVQADWVIQSPGVPWDSLPSIRARRAGIPVIGEIELAYTVCPSTILAVTGTNGKTTATALLGQMIQDGGGDVFVGGNIGVPFISKVDALTEHQRVVLEVSSFQLETVDRFKPKVAVILNITPDHLDRHGGFETYIAAKTAVFKNQGPEDWLILNGDDPLVRPLAQQARSRVLFFSRRPLTGPGACLNEGVLQIQDQDRVYPVIRQDEIRIRGAHNIENALAALLAGWVAGVPVDSLRRSLKTFPGVAHRLEPVLEWEGVLYVNDSKGTNTDAAIKALEAFERPVILIAGGLGKGADYGPFAKVIRERAKYVVLIGKDGEKIRHALEQAGFMDRVQAQSMEEAVSKARTLAEPGDVVLLSPACASYDMFHNFEHRGDVFKQIVRDMAGKEGSHGG